MLSQTKMSDVDGDANYDNVENNDKNDEDYDNDEDMMLLDEEKGTYQ